jgi:hypothetical protein
VFTNQSDAISGDLTDLLTYLEASFRSETQQPVGIQLNSDAFLVWAKKHLSEVRPSEVFAVDNNYGILLTNGQRVKLCPSVVGEETRTGDMANPDQSIPVTRMR